MSFRVFIGYDPSEDRACRVAALSLQRRASAAVDISFLRLEDLRQCGLYTRPTETRGGHLYDVRSAAPMSTEHAVSRFFLPFMVDPDVTEWALFTDGDVLVREDILQILGEADSKFAIQCVQHQHAGEEGVKKGGHVQTSYARKNWSSVMLWNLRHPAHRRLHADMANDRPGRDLHRFCWLNDNEIGALQPRWNHLVGVTGQPGGPTAIAHYTLGLPYVSGYTTGIYAEEWREEAALLEGVKHDRV